MATRPSAMARSWTHWARPDPARCRQRFSHARRGCQPQCGAQVIVPSGFFLPTIAPGAQRDCGRSDRCRRAGGSTREGSFLSMDGWLWMAAASCVSISRSGHGELWASRWHGTHRRGGGACFRLIRSAVVDRCEFPRFRELDALTRWLVSARPSGAWPGGQSQPGWSGCAHLWRSRRMGR